LPKKLQYQAFLLFFMSFGGDYLTVAPNPLSI